MQSSGHIVTGNPVSAVFGQFAERSGTTLSSIGNRLLSFLPSKSKRRKQQVQDPQALRERAMQSARIQLRLLAQQEKWSEIVCIAESTDNDEIAAVAILELVQAKNFVSILTGMAKRDSKAALRSVIAMINNACLDDAVDIFVERMNNGDYARLVQSGFVNPFSILDILGLIEDENAVEHFDALWHCLSPTPQLQYKLMGQILGDSDPLGCRYKFEGNMIAQKVKMRALELSEQFVPADRERALWFATRDDDDFLAYHATVNLAQHWQSDNGLVPFGLEPFALLDINLLHYLCQLSAAFQWTEPSGADAVYARFKTDREQLVNIDPVQDALAYQTVVKRLEQAEDEIKHITERRVNCLQPLLNQISRALNLPNAMLVATDRDCCAAYVVGTGRIEINRSILMEDKPLSEELMSSILHEMGHMEQDVLVIRMIADELGLIFGQHSKLLLPLYERYSAGIGYAPQSMFLLAVLRLRNDQPLAEAQRLRAKRLHESAYMTAVYGARAKAVEERLGRIAVSANSLKDGLYDAQLLSCLNNQRGLNSLFQRGEVPGILLYEIERCKRELDLLLTSVFKEKTAPKNLVKRAAQLYKSPDHKALLEPIVESLKAVLLEVLNEEYRNLDKILLELKRAGYHEAEAYTISDRVEVLVKALRKGWVEG